MQVQGDKEQLPPSPGDLRVLLYVGLPQIVGEQKMNHWVRYVSDTWMVWGLFGMAAFVTWAMLK